MKKQTLGRVWMLLLAGLILAMPAVAFGQGASSPSPFEDDGAFPDSDATAADEDQQVMQDAAADSANNRRAVDLPLKRKAKVVEKKLYPKDLKHELNLYFGINPSDSFVFSLVEGARYNFHINEMFGVQAVFGYMQSFDRNATSLLTDSVDKGGLEIDKDFIKNSEVQWFANADFVFYPVYGKFALLSSVIAHYDVGVYVGGGVMATASGDYAPAPDLGLVGNIYINKWLSLRADFMYYAMISKDKRSQPSSDVGGTLGGTDQDSEERGGYLLRNNYFVTLGVSFHLPVD